MVRQVAGSAGSLVGGAREGTGTAPELILMRYTPSLPGSTEPPAICHADLTLGVICWRGVRADRLGRGPLGLGWWGRTGKELDVYWEGTGSATVSVAENCPRPGVQRAVRSLERLGKAKQVRLSLGFGLWEPEARGQACALPPATVLAGPWEGCAGPGARGGIQPLTLETSLALLLLAPGLTWGLTQ